MNKGMIVELGCGVSAQAETPRPQGVQNRASGFAPVTIPAARKQKRLENPQPMAMLDSDGTWGPFTPTTDLVKRLVERRNAAILGGAKCHTGEEILNALAEERAGYDGFGKLWGK
jgi:hypothetical protein